MRLEQLLSKAAELAGDDGVDANIPPELAAELGSHLFMSIDQKPRALLRRGGRDQLFLQEVETVLLAFKSLTTSHVFSHPCHFIHPVEPLLAITFPSSLSTFTISQFPNLGCDKDKNVERKVYKDSRSSRGVPDRPDALILQFQDSFFRLLGHGICQWHGLKSTSIPHSSGLVQIRRKWEPEVYQHSLLLMDYLNTRYPRKF